MGRRAERPPLRSSPARHLRAPICHAQWAAWLPYSRGTTESDPTNLAMLAQLSSVMRLARPKTILPDTIQPDTIQMAAPLRNQR